MCSCCKEFEECAGCGQIRDTYYLFQGDDEKYYCDNNKCEFINKKAEERKMKPFDLERALAGDPVITRDGRKVLDFYLFKGLGKDFRPLAYVIEGDHQLCYAQEDGFLCTEITPTSHDLVMAPKIKTYWMNLYRGFGNNNEDCLLGRTFETKEIAIDSIVNDGTFVKTISFEIEE